MQLGDSPTRSASAPRDDSPLTLWSVRPSLLRAAGVVCLSRPAQSPPPWFSASALASAASVRPAAMLVCSGPREGKWAGWSTAG